MKFKGFFSRCLQNDSALRLVDQVAKVKTHGRGVLNVAKPSGVLELLTWPSDVKYKTILATGSVREVAALK